MRTLIFLYWTSHAALHTPGSLHWAFPWCPAHPWIPALSLPIMPCAPLDPCTLPSHDALCTSGSLHFAFPWGPVHPWIPPLSHPTRPCVSLYPCTSFYLVSVVFCSLNHLYYTVTSWGVSSPHLLSTWHMPGWTCWILYVSVRAEEQEKKQGN